MRFDLFFEKLLIRTGRDAGLRKYQMLEVTSSFLAIKYPERQPWNSNLKIRSLHSDVLFGQTIGNFCLDSWPKTINF